MMLLHNYVSIKIPKNTLIFSAQISVLEDCKGIHK